MNKIRQDLKINKVYYGDFNNIESRYKIIIFIVTNKNCSLKVSVILRIPEARNFYNLSL
ncbi:hypothetical protein [uncultured Brachyspira sp.]|uniref:hypothetical protein n=1 Tax=uncultured Brachyspira sp. TaxID=221953 RepID=UPI0025F4D288|nr:hypothetical protein [uncultured Brachyspira sp.]